MIDTNEPMLPQDQPRSASEVDTSKLSPEAPKKGRNRRGRKRGNKEVEKYIESKMCEICKGQDNEARLLLCDRCDDSYHTYCLNPPLNGLPEKDWICSICVSQQEEMRKKKERDRANEVEEIDCHSCKESLKKVPVIKGTDWQGQTVEIPLKTLKNIKCLFCGHTFHNDCFSQRKNSLNCWPCEKEIRKKGPKCHDDFMKFIEECVRSVNDPSCSFSPIINLEHDEDMQRHRCFRLKVPSYMTTWQSIAENEASIYYAFKTKGLTFIDDQLYEKQEYEYMMSLNNPRKDINGPIMRLHQKDEKTYQQFKVNAEKGYVGPFQVKQDRFKGFFLIATEYIQPLTIISEYLGEVKTARIAINFQENDSIFLLVRSARSAQSLDIVPQKYGNISRFFLGINNEYQRKHSNEKLQNVKSLRFSYKGRVRLMLYTCKPIQAGQTLYFNYNGSAFHEYPTQHFIV